METRNVKPVLIQVHKDYVRQSEGLIAWLVDKQGNLLEKAAFKNGQAQLKAKSRELRGKASLYFSPAFPKEIERLKVNETLLVKSGAYQPSVKFREGHILDLNFLPDFNFFIFRVCNITGKVTKTITVDGVNHVVPVCNVRVHICEVDPVWFILPLIPDLEIFDIRDRILDVIIKEKFPPDPIPDPFPDPIGPVIKRFSGNVEMASSSEKQELRLLSMPILDDEVISGLSSPSQKMIRQTLHDHFQVLRPYLCLFPRHWPFLYHCDEIATVYPDCNGRFEHKYFYRASGDKPDIYIWVEANIGGSWETVYRPHKACGTHWNYHCGTDINIRITDPRVVPCECAPMPGQVVWMKRVNDGVTIRNIRQDSGPSGHLSNAVGLTRYSGGNDVSPFALAFPLVVQFGSGFPSGNVTHYRWRYRQVKDAALNTVTDPYKTFDGTLHKHYTYERINSDGDTVFYTGSFQLGPFPSATGSMFRIPHAEAAVDVPAEPTAEWNQDTDSVNINSVNLNDGLYEFVFELLDNNGNIVPLDKDVFVVHKKTGELSNPPDAPTITAFGRPENYLMMNSSGKAVGFRFMMRIDNEVCYPHINDALVDGSATHSVCGFGQYHNKNTSLVTLSFEASHPQDFATYGFSVVKGNGNPAGPTNTSGYVTQANNGYTVFNNVFTKMVAVSDMLGTCDKAAFAENLHVWATHTNGNRRIHEYDRHDSAAFAIEPHHPSASPHP